MAVTVQRYSILVVDDNPTVLETFTELLENEDLRTIPALNGNEALQLVEREPVDLVVLDVRMPGLTGIDVLKSLRQAHRPEELPVIMATALGESQDIVQAFELGANDYVTKPFDLPVVMARIHTQLRSRVPAAERNGQPAGRPALADLEPGTVLDGRYRLDSKIGEGQFGVVYRATHLKLKHTVAVKMLRTGVQCDRDLRVRFQREGMSACRLQHANAVSVLDFSFTTEGMPFMVMELLEGHSLAQEIRREGRLTASRCAEILLPVCEVLSEAHALGIIHRDVKPQNIFLHRGRRGEVVKVLDFGLAKLVGETVMNQQRLTLEGTVGPGTPLYMAPERFTELPYDGGADVYSLGVMVYEMLVGEPPFMANDGNPLNLALMHVSDPPRPLRELNPEVPPAVEEIVLQALEKEPENRPSARDLGIGFAAALGFCVLSPSVVVPDGGALPPPAEALADGAREEEEGTACRSSIRAGSCISALPGVF